jgi:hypothetical protein
MKIPAGNLPDEDFFTVKTGNLKGMIFPHQPQQVIERDPVNADDFSVLELVFVKGAIVHQKIDVLKLAVKDVPAALFIAEPSQVNETLPVGNDAQLLFGFLVYFIVRKAKGNMPAHGDVEAVGIHFFLQRTMLKEHLGRVSDAPHDPQMHPFMGNARSVAQGAGSRFARWRSVHPVPDFE